MRAFRPAGSADRLQRPRGASLRRLVPTNQLRGQFGYDDLGRLTSTATGALLWGTRTLTYDAMGNMKKSTLGATLTYSGSLPKLTSVVEAGVTTPVTYDPASNELTATKVSTISPRNYVAQMSTAAVDYLYKYDGRGLRTWTSELPKPATGTTTRRYHFYTPDLRFLARTDYTVTATSTTIARSIEPVWFAGLPVAQIDYNDLSTLRYTFTDHLGLPVLQTSPTGAIIWQMEFEPYGRLYRVRTGKESAQPLRLPGQELTMDGKEYYNVFRWYRSWWGRYTQADPIGVALSGQNLYAYVGGNPVLFKDPSGLVRIRQGFQRLGGQFGGGGMYSLGFGRAFTNGRCVGYPGEWRIELSLSSRPICCLMHVCSISRTANASLSRGATSQPTT